MKVGDLVNYTEGDTSGFQGLIIGGPKRDFLEHYNNNNPQWEVFWMDQHNNNESIKIGWWDEFRLEVISESG